MVISLAHPPPFLYCLTLSSLCCMVRLVFGVVVLAKIMSNRSLVILELITVDEKLLVCQV